MRRLRAISPAIGCLLLAAGCGGGSGGAEDVAGGTITVFAASSLSDAFAQIAGAFEDTRPGASVRLNFGGSSSLREQVLSGAPVDVIASADESNMDELVAAGEVQDPEIFSTNRLQIVVPADNPGSVDDLSDLADPDLLIGLCAEGVPCGTFARQALSRAGVEPSVDTNEPDVRALLTKIEAGELDAGLVYVTDVVSAGDRVRGIDLPPRAHVRARYPIAVTSSADAPDLAASFVRFVVGPDAQAILRTHGFGGP